MTVHTNELHIETIEHVVVYITILSERIYRVHTIHCKWDLKYENRPRRMTREKNKRFFFLLLLLFFCLKRETHEDEIKMSKELRRRRRRMMHFSIFGFINTSISKRGKTNNLCSNTVQIGCHNGHKRMRYSSKVYLCVQVANQNKNNLSKTEGEWWWESVERASERTNDEERRYRTQRAAIVSQSQATLLGSWSGCLTGCAHSAIGANERQKGRISK